MATRKESTVAFGSLNMTPSQASMAMKYMVNIAQQETLAGNDNRAVFLWGPPGIGKSSIVKQVAKELGMEVVDIRLSQMEPTDLRGVPVPVKDSCGNYHEVTWVPPAILPRNEDANVIIMLDELPNAAPSIQAAAYELVLDRRLGEYKVPPKCVVVAAGNNETDRAATFKMPSPLANRFIHINVEANIDDWRLYALNKGIDAIVLSYLERNKTELFAFNPQTALRGFPTPRSWEAVSAILKDASQLPRSILMSLIAGAIGEAVAIKLMAHRDNVEAMPIPTSVLTGELKPNKKDPLEIQIQWALGYACSYELKENKTKLTKMKEELDRYTSSKMGHKNELDAMKKAYKDQERVFNDGMVNFITYMMHGFSPEVMIAAIRTLIVVFGLAVPTSAPIWKEFVERWGNAINSA